ncbi:cysteine hydrolase [bacterium]|nr:cysteine hydrolase [bacterium]MBU1025459.1 cysteine hydrolase [bacterium]
MKTVFFDIDTQYDFIMPNGNLYVPGAVNLIPNFQKLSEIALEYGIKVVSSADAHIMDDPEFEFFPPHCIKGEPGWLKIPETTFEDIYHIKNEEEKMNGGPSAQQIVLEKTEFSMWSNPNTERLLVGLGLKRAIVYGVATDYCVKAAALGLIKRGYETYVVEDAIAAVSPETNTTALEEMKEVGVKFIKTKDVEGLLE